jgi:hypothetical protein
VVAHLPFREQHDDRTFFTVTNRVQFGVQTPSHGTSLNWSRRAKRLGTFNP